MTHTTPVYIDTDSWGTIQAVHDAPNSGPDARRSVAGSRQTVTHRGWVYRVPAGWGDPHDGPVTGTLALALGPA